MKTFTPLDMVSKHFDVFSVFFMQCFEELHLKCPYVHSSCLLVWRAREIANVNNDRLSQLVTYLNDNINFATWARTSNIIMGPLTWIDVQTKSLARRPGHSLSMPKIEIHPTNLIFERKINLTI